MSSSEVVKNLKEAGKINQAIQPGFKYNHDLVTNNGYEHHLLPGDLLLFSRNPENKIAGILARFLRRLDRLWDGWGWHMAYVYDAPIDGSIIIAEAKISIGVQLIKYADHKSLGDVRAYRWIDSLILSELKTYTQMHMGCTYDMACYFWTGLQLLVRRLFGILIPRINNNKYTCWELVCDMTQSMGKPLQPVEVYPVITDIVKVLGRDRVDLY